MNDIVDDETLLITGNEENQYLLFLVGSDLYAIEALKTNEIVEYSKITKVPMMYEYVKGVTNIRGNIVPVIDLLQRFGLGTTQIQPKTSIVVINHHHNNTIMQIGVIIDEVYEVDDILPSDMKESPEFGSKVSKEFIRCMGKYNSEYIAILNTDTILDIDELSKLRV